MRHVILAVTVFAFMSPARATAQDVLWFEPGAKVRVTAPTLGLDGHTGVIQELTGDRLYLATETNGPLQVHRIPMSAIAKLDVRTGRRSHWVKGAGIGALVGLIRGVQVARSDDYPDDDPMEIGVGVVTGALLGIGIGSLIKSDQWTEVPLGQSRPRLIAGRDGVGIGVSLGF